MHTKYLNENDAQAVETRKSANQYFALTELCVYISCWTKWHAQAE